ncbi:MAG TPA: succinylglutamate desuccinylase [Candidatus Limnocylindria bacterium]|nr:succinylglutamate desuccinylase [Candidatus Limnocylindria bacterium]
MKPSSVKIVTAVIVLAAVAAAGYLFREHRTYREPVVASEALTAVKKLSDYSSAVRGTVNDANVYIFDSGVPGGTLLLIGGTHAEEPTANVSAQVFTENVRPAAGKLVVIHRVNTSASTVTRMGEAYPRFFHVKTPWGEKQWRFGDRVASALDSWPDPEVYVHYPSGQNLAYMDVRNINRNWPGRADGMLTERTAYAMMRLIEQEGVDLTVDFHEAELEYPVENTIVTHEKGYDVAAMTSMMLTAQTFDVPIGMEFSPKALHGLSHREIGDHSDAASYLVEVAEPMLDRIRGITDEELLMSGKDRFVMQAGARGLLYAPIDEDGWPFDKRVARHVATVTTLLQVHNMVHPDKAVVLEGIPAYADILANGTGNYLHDPSAAPQGRVFFD